MNRYAFLRFPGFRRKALTLNYDDGTVYDEKMIEIMKAHGIKGTFNLDSAMFGQGRRLTEEKVRELYLPNDMEIASHGANHLRPEDVTGAQFAMDVLKDREILEEITGAPVVGFAFAYGSRSDEVREFLRYTGTKYARGAADLGDLQLPENWLNITGTCRHRNPKLFEYCDNFLNLKESKVEWNNYPRWFFMWGHSYEFNDNENWDLLEQFCEKMGGHEDVWYVTTGEMYEYVAAYNALQFSVNRSSVYNPTVTDVYLFEGGKQVIAAAGKVTRII